MRPRATRPARRQQQGAALLLAMIILTLVATLASSMIWQQWRAISVEAAERGRAQSSWVLTGALDWAGLILNEDLKADQRAQKLVDHLGEPWAVPLAEARLSTFLAADQGNNADDGSGPDAFLSGEIADAQARYNLNNLVLNSDPKVRAAELAVLQKLCESISVPSSTAQAIASGLQASGEGGEGAALAPQSVADLAWFGVDPADLKRLEPFVVLLPEITIVNLNTASREVIAAAGDGVDLASADRLVQVRQREPFASVQNAAAQLQVEPAKLARTGVSTNYFLVQGRVRLGDRVLQERSLVHRTDGIRTVQVLRRERVNLLAGS